MNPSVGIPARGGVVVVDRNAFTRSIFLGQTAGLAADAAMFEELEPAVRSLRERLPGSLFVSRKALQEAPATLLLELAQAVTTLRVRVTVMLGKGEPRDTGTQVVTLPVVWYVTVPFPPEVAHRIAAGLPANHDSATPGASMAQDGPGWGLAPGGTPLGRITGRMPQVSAPDLHVATPPPRDQPEPPLGIPSRHTSGRLPAIPGIDARPFPHPPPPPVAPRQTSGRMPAVSTASRQASGRMPAVSGTPPGVGYSSAGAPPGPGPAGMGPPSTASRAGSLPDAGAWDDTTAPKGVVIPSLTLVTASGEPHAGPAPPGEEALPTCLGDIAPRLAGRDPEKMDYLDLLGLPAEATRKDILRAYLALVQRCGPDVTLRISDPLLVKLLQALHQRVTEAWQVLGDEDRRRQYLATRGARAG
jgi:hypothetical protein